MRLNLKVWLAVGVAVLAVVGIILIAILSIHHSPFEPVRKQISFLVFAPGDPYEVDPKSVSYDDKAKVLYFKAQAGSGAVLNFNEQATPDSFVDVPEVYSKLTEKLQEYKTLDTAAGRVSLTHPVELKGKQTAVVLSQGTMIFVRPDKDLSEDDWRELFNHLVIIK